MLDTPLLVHGRFKNGGLIKQNDSSRLVTRQSYNGAAFFICPFCWTRQPLTCRKQSLVTTPGRRSLAVKPLLRFFHISMDLTSREKDSHRP